MRKTYVVGFRRWRGWLRAELNFLELSLRIIKSTQLISSLLHSWSRSSFFLAHAIDVSVLFSKRSNSDNSASTLRKIHDVGFVSIFNRPRPRTIQPPKLQMMDSNQLLASVCSSLLLGLDTNQTSLSSSSPSDPAEVPSPR